MIEVRRVILGFVLVVFFFIAAVVIIAPLLAELEMTGAAILAAEGHTDLAMKKFETAIRIDPFNSAYLCAFADFLISLSGQSIDKILLLRQANSLCARALNLNPVNPEYAVRLGQIVLDIDKGSIEEAFKYFGIALENDPNGFNTAYGIGYAGMAMWDRLNDFRKELILNRLRYSLSIRPLYYDTIYHIVWKKTGSFEKLKIVTPDSLEANMLLYDFIRENDLWQFRKEQKEVVDSYKAKEMSEKFKAEITERSNAISKIKSSISNPLAIDGKVLSSEWYGKISYGKEEYKDGVMYWPGTMSAIIKVYRGISTLVIEARGLPVRGVYPYMIVELDGEWVGESFIDNIEWREYCFPVVSDGGLKVLSITFANDAVDPGRGEDRNLYIRKAEIVDKKSVLKENHDYQ